MEIPPKSNAQKLLLVLNPVSGGGDNSNVPDEFSRQANAHGYTPEVFTTTGEDDPQKLAGKIADFHPDYLIAAGGDGTVTMVATTLVDLVQQAIPIGILPLGSANGLATELGVNNDMPALFASIATGDAHPIDMIEVVGEQYSLHLSGVGFNANLIRRRDLQGDRGMIGYVRAFFQTLVRKNRATYQITRNGETWQESHAIMITVANARKYGTGAVVNPEGRMDDGKFEVCVIKSFPFYRLFAIAFRFFFGGIKQSPYTFYYPAESATIEVDEPQSVEIDGEVIGKRKKITWKIIPQAIQIIHSPNTP